MGLNRVARICYLEMIHQHRIDPPQKEVTLMNHPIVCHFAKRIRKDYPEIGKWNSERFAIIILGIALSQHCWQRRIAEALILADLVETEDHLTVQRRIVRTLADRSWCVQEWFRRWITKVYTALPRNVRRNLVLIVDETKISKNHRAMIVSIAFERRSIPIIWRVYNENDADSYPEEGQVQMIADMLAIVKSCISVKWKVRIVVDRGIGNSPTLCDEIKALTWNFLFRITNSVKIDTEDGRLLPKERIAPGKRFGAHGRIWVTKGQVQGYIRAVWDKDCKEPWILATNDPSLDGTEYAIRGWIEHTFRDMKTYGWNIEACRVKDAESMNRFLCIVVMALGMIMALGSLAIEKGQARNLYKKPNGEHRSQNSLFGTGLQYFVKLFAGKKRLPKLKFYLDNRWHHLPVVP